MNTPFIAIIFLSIYLCFNVVFSQSSSKFYSPDVQSYYLQLEPNLQTQTIQGHVQIECLVDTGIREIAFDCGNLQIHSTSGKGIQGFRQSGKRVLITLSDPNLSSYIIDISYSGKPSRGLIFLPDRESAYTVYFTSEWMVCNDDPSDKATIRMDLLIPSSKMCVASGTFLQNQVEGDKNLYSWTQTYATPSYTYGFVIGNFFQTTFILQESGQSTSLYAYSPKHRLQELNSIFSNTGGMLSFFIEKSGIPYPQESYSQVLIGDHYQEMSGFAVLKSSYGELVLADSTETNLISHELAHQWWGNRITCKDWNHFWLNEGMATFMSAAYNEHRFGKEVYEANIQSYANVYQAIRDRGHDKPLVFHSWNNPSRDDRNLVYFKGAYVLHLLREEMGDQAFWSGIRRYSQEYLGKSVETADFQKSMEASMKKSLQPFFDKWVYGNL